jgi:hypothetical protein
MQTRKNKGGRPKHKTPQWAADYIAQFCELVEAGDFHVRAQVYAKMRGSKQLMSEARKILDKHGMEAEVQYQGESVPVSYIFEELDIACNKLEANTYEAALTAPKGQNAAPIFALKAGHGWRDNSQIEHSGKVDTAIQFVFEDTSS